MSDQPAPAPGAQPCGVPAQDPGHAAPETPAPGAQPCGVAGQDPGRAAAAPPGEAAGRDRLARAVRALQEARADARSRGFRSAPAKDPDTEIDTPGQRPPGDGRPARRQRLGDPQPLGTAISGLVAATGWEVAVTAGSLFGRWAEIVGPDLAAHTTPEGLADGELTVSADSTAWATQLRLLAGELVRRLNTELGDRTVLRVKVRGPAGPARRPGEWRVRGGRGPRDTYG